MICPVLVEEKDLEELKQDQVQLAKGILELNQKMQVYAKVCDDLKTRYDMMESADCGNLNNLRGKMSEFDSKIRNLEKELQEMPGGYRNSQDIKNLKGRIERIENVIAYVPDLVKKVEKLEYADKGVQTLLAHRTERLEKIEELLQSGGRVTVHSSLNDLEERIGLVKDDYHQHILDLRQEKDKDVKRLEECCKNTVASGKELEKRVDNLSGRVQGIVEDLPDRMQRVERQCSANLHFIREFESTIAKRVRDVLKSL